MKLGLHQSLRLEQRLLQSPQMIQAMQILQLPSLELRERVERELEENPFLEVVEPEAPPPEETRPSREELSIDGARLEVIGRLERMLEERPPGPGAARHPGSNGEEDPHYDALLNAPDPHGTIADRLLPDLRSEEMTERERQIGEYILNCLDARGYLVAGLEEIVTGLAAELPDVTVEEVAAVLERVRRLGPPGIGARDLRECLLLQIERLGGRGDLERLLVERYLPDLANNRLPKIVRETGASLEEIKEAVAFLKTLDPAPGAGLDAGRAAAIMPDVLVEELEGEFVVTLERGDLPPIRVSPDFRRFLEEAKVDRGAFELLKRKLESAKWLIEAIGQRESTLLRIAKEVVRRQRDFLEHGPSRLRPMRMQEIADAVGVHISTVSRAIKGKYMQTPRGIVEMRSFFTGGTEMETGEVESQTAIKERVRALVETEDARRPLSDEEIADRLREQGLAIARRTVTKYRRALGIRPSSVRRAY
ncbi:MAG TPA: RNA polymerase factor sigma-54 [Planctomycetota bacterium]|jgi:RNA polymerase sigma-54 factor|nr:RNA polymerase factor sigma-54 [Planctomycetota bacterium]